jgi:toxin ParE1/3/4
VPRALHRHPEALADVEESAVYIGADNIAAALRFLDAVETTLRLLLKHPELGSGRRFERSELAGVRSFPVKGFDKHLSFYRPTEWGIEVLRVLHGARDLGTIFDESLHERPMQALRS